MQHVLKRGGSVRLIGDDQQLAAIGAGGVLRDIQATHGALRLTELVRFADRAEGSASLALREGHTSALGFYLDQRRIHVGDATTMADDLFAAWSADRAGGLDSIMLAPTRELVADLNQQARTHASTAPDRAARSSWPTATWPRSATRSSPAPTTANSASSGDRLGEERRPLDHPRRRPEAAASTPATPSPDATSSCPPTTSPSRSNWAMRPPPTPRKGVTADTMHGLLAGTESRQQAYTMLTRGREANHAYVVVVGDGDPHTLIHPETVNPLTPTDVLERILARDESPVSATTALREAANPARQLGDAAARYTDAVSFATTQLAGELGSRSLERAIDDMAPGLTGAPTWPALRAQLLSVQADDRDPIQALARARIIPITDGQDPCVVLAGRIADANLTHRGGPLPWLVRIPAALTRDPIWGAYLDARQRLVSQLADQVRAEALSAETRPAWLAGTGRTAPELVADIEVWRAAHWVETTDTRPTGERRNSLAEHRWQTHLDRRLASTADAAMSEWRPLLSQVSPLVLADDFAPTLAGRLSQLSSAGINVPSLLRTAATRVRCPTTTPRPRCGGGYPATSAPPSPKPSTPTTTWPPNGYQPSPNGSVKLPTNCKTAPGGPRW